MPESEYLPEKPKDGRNEPPRTPDDPENADVSDLPMLPRILTWRPVESAATDMFPLFSEPGELAWAEQAWGYIVAAGLASAGTNLERCRASVRFMALATLYLDWCSLAWDEVHDDDVDSSADLLEIEPSTLVACSVRSRS
jgi:hypothetical protein